LYPWAAGRAVREAGLDPGGRGRKAAEVQRSEHLRVRALGGVHRKLPSVRVTRARHAKEVNAGTAQAKRFDGISRATLNKGGTHSAWLAHLGRQKAAHRGRLGQC